MLSAGVSFGEGCVRPLERLRRGSTADIRRGLRNATVERLGPREAYNQTSHVVLLQGRVTVARDQEPELVEGPAVVPWLPPLSDKYAPGLPGRLHPQSTYLTCSRTMRKRLNPLSRAGTSLLLQPRISRAPQEQLLPQLCPLVANRNARRHVNPRA